MPVYVFRADALVSVKSRPIIVEAESLEDAEEQAFSIVAEQWPNLIDPSTISTEYREVEGVVAV
jgi:hypothetical protein